MNRHVLFRLFTPGLVVLVLFVSHCTKPFEQRKEEVIADLTEYLNTRMHGGEVEIDPETTVVKSIEKNRYHITLKNSVFITDLTEIVSMLYKLLSSGDDPYSEMESGRMEEVTMIYGPKEKYLQLLSIKGLSVEGNFSKSNGTNHSSALGGLEAEKISITVGKITFTSPGNNDSGSSESMEHLKIKFSGSTAKRDKISILLDIEKIGKVDTGKEDDTISGYFLDQNAKQPDLKLALEKGAAINDLTIQLGKVNILVNKNGGKLCSGGIERILYKQFAKPDDTGKFFKLGNGLHFENLELSLPGNKKLQLLSNVKEFCFDYTLNNLSPEAALAFLDLIKMGFTSRTQAGSSQMGEYTALVTKFMFEAIKSKFKMTFSISPFNHYFGDIAATAEINLNYLMAGPLFTVKVTLFNVDNILNKLNESGIFPADTLKTIADTIEQYTVKRGNGDAFFIQEMDINQFRNMLNKENPLIPPTAQNPTFFQRP